MLSGPELRDKLENGRLVIAPPIPDLDNLGVAIDLTLHNVFWRSTLPEIEDVEVVIGLNADPYEWMHSSGDRECLSSLANEPYADLERELDRLANRSRCRSPARGGP